MIKLSLILPVFNAEKFLQDTFESIREQEMDKSLYEVVVVDDGSIDSSPEIIQKFNSYFPHFKYHSQENSGVSAARNRGLELATGEYILFIDADDTLKKDIFSRVLNIVKKSTSDIYFFSGSYPAEPVKYEPNTFLSDVYFSVFVWKTCIRRQFIIENNLKFSEGYILEDGVFLLEAIVKAKEIATVQLEPILHTMNRNSLMRDYSNPEKNRNMIASFVFVINKYEQLICKNKGWLNSQAHNNLAERKESFIFFMYFRMVRYGFAARQIEENLKKVQFKTFRVFPGRHFQRLNYRILAKIIERKPLRTIMSVVYQTLKSKSADA